MRFKTLRPPVVIFRSVHFKMGKHSQISHKAGTLNVGSKWDISRYRQSELKVCDNGTLEIRGNMSIYTGCSIDVCEGATLSLGSGYINNGVRIVAFDRITIGDNVAISENVTLRDSNNHAIAGSTQPVTSPIVIGNNVWIGLNVTILKGVTVGDGAVIAANSLVNKDVPARTLVAGVPARTVKQDIDWA